MKSYCITIYVLKVVELYLGYPLVKTLADRHFSSSKKNLNQKYETECCVHSMITMSFYMNIDSGIMKETLKNTVYSNYDHWLSGRGRHSTYVVS
jgi:hypothetical protein